MDFKMSLVVAIFALAASSCVMGYDPSPVQDFCVPDPEVYMCKKNVTADDLYFSGLDVIGDTKNKKGSSTNLVDVTKFPGLNTMGISIGRVDFAPYGIHPPHTHPRGTVILTVLEGTIGFGLITSSPENRLIYKKMNKGDIFVCPMGLIHYQINLKNTPAVALIALNSQNPGEVEASDSTFGAKPAISVDVLAKAFQMDKEAVEAIQKRFAQGDN